MSTVQVINEQVPCVIDQSLLERKAAEKNLPVHELQSLDLHLNKIFMIESLWNLQKLTVLRLNDNCIEKIENLNILVNLQELNLSFNRICKIENLDKLVNIERLFLHSNKISKLENLDSLQSLHVLSASNNCIESKDNVVYLRRLKKLQALTLDGNPFCEDPHYKDFILVFLPGLRYYEYNFISEEDRAIKSSENRQLLTKVEEEELELEEKRLNEKGSAAQNVLLQRAFVSTIEPKILLEPLVLKNWKVILQIGGDVMQTLQKAHKEQIEKVCQELQNIALERLYEREEEILIFEEIVEKACLDNQLQGLRQVEVCLLPKEDICDNLRKLLSVAERKKSFEDSAEMDRVRNIANALIHDYELLKENLLILEVELEEQVEGVINSFSLNMEMLVEDFKYEAKQKILHLRELEQHFHQSLIEPCLVRAANLRMQGKLTKEKHFLSKLSLELANDPTTLMEKLIENHDARLQAILIQEIKFNNDCELWLESIIDKFKEMEFDRGRARVLELSTFIDLQQQELMDLQPASSLPSLGLL